jgi:transketolase-like protein
LDGSVKSSQFSHLAEIFVTCRHLGRDQPLPSHDRDIQSGPEPPGKAGAGEAALCGQNPWLYKMAGAGHIGSSLSCLEILVDLCFCRLENDDIVVLSKGHAAATLYTTVALSGRLPEAEVSSFYKDGTLLSAHPPCSGAIRAIPFGTGSLGHGLGLACGIAFSCHFTGKSFKRFSSFIRRRL